MSVLFISSSFFGYAAHIKKELEARYGKVFWYEDRPSISFLGKVKARLLPSLSERLANAFFKRIADENKNNNIKEVFVIKGEALSIESIRYLRRMFPDACFRLYFWDGYKNMPPSSAAKVDLFDRAFSFDLEDVKNDPRLAYRPLFYIPIYSSSDGGSPDIDLTFVGTVHSDRYKIIKRIERSLSDEDMRFHKALYFPSKIIFWARRIFDPSFWRIKKGDFIFTPMSGLEISALVARSKAVLDIERTVQSGFTMRTLEILGSSNKLITTNKNIVEADFYDPRNILVIDRERPEIPLEFFSSPKVEIHESIKARYSLAAWLDDIFSGTSK